MSRSLLLFPLLLAACPSPDPAIPVEGGGEGPEGVLDADASSMSFAFSVEVDEQVMSFDADRRDSALLTVGLDLESYLGACPADPCNVTVEAEIRDAYGELLDDGEALLVSGQGGLLELHVDDPLAGCADDVLCARDFTVDLALASDGYVTMRSSAFASVWIEADEENPIFEEQHVEVVWND